MSRLKELIQEYCPDGVEWLTFGELCSIITKQTGFDYTKTIKDSLLREQRGNSVPYIQTKFFNGKNFIFDTDYYVPETIVSQYPKITLENKCILFSIVGASIGNVGLYPGDRKSFLGGAICVAKPNGKANVDYMYYCAESNIVQRQISRKIKGAGQATVTIEDIRKFTIPVPPLPVQQEIVRILDSFSNLEHELEHELELRKKQYTTYRDILMSSITDAELKPLGETCLLKAGKSMSSSKIHQNKDSINLYSCFGANGSRGFVQSYNYEGNYPIIGRQGALCGNVAYASGKFYATEHAVVADGQNTYDPRFLYHMLSWMNLSQYKTAGAQPGLSVARLNEVPAPVINSDEQKRIAGILDKFDTYCTDLTSGLPAEISLRKKQYEYYRDRLLSFPRKA